MRVDQFDFDLPEDRIALRPAERRDAARMLVVRPGATPELADGTIASLPDLLRPGDALVVNNSRVIAARLHGTRRREDSIARIEATLHLRASPSSWWAFLRPAKKAQVGETIRFGAQAQGQACALSSLMARVVEKRGEGEARLEFELSGPALDDALDGIASIPLPPYIASRRPEDDRDRADYQTIFARRPGAVAAPTAGLHFTDDLLARLDSRGVSRFEVTLHVGAGTFLPVKAEDTERHAMHAELFEIDEGTAAGLNEIRSRGGRLVCVGTTSLRAVETATGNDGLVKPFKGETRLFVTPGWRFRATDLLLTNFHLPRSTLFMLVSAYCGLDVMKRAYAHAVEQGYRFYSYGDACLLHPAADAR